jgi:very-short-patch-repair endonuclease
MASLRSQTLGKEVWRLASEQHGVIALFQLLELGYTMSAIKHRIARGRLHPVRAGVYAVGRPDLTREGEWMAAVLSCGPDAVLSHGSAAALWGLVTERESRIHVTVPSARDRRQPGSALHRRSTLGTGDVTRRRGIPITAPTRTLMDLANVVPGRVLEAAVNEADKLDLVYPDELRIELELRKGQPGVRPLRALLNKATFTLTDSELERRFLPIARRAGLGKPRTQAQVCGFRVDFYWPELGLVVETDGLRYHRTPSAQARDRVRDQAHAAAGLAHLRFTHWQVRYDAKIVQHTLKAVAARRRQAASAISEPL